VIYNLKRTKADPPWDKIELVRIIYEDTIAKIPDGSYLLYQDSLKKRRKEAASRSADRLRQEFNDSRDSYKRRL
jgi:hypothetical protein